MLFCYARAVITVVLGIKLGFKVTSKDAESSEFRKSFNWCIPFILYYFAGSVSIAFGILHMIDIYKNGNDLNNMIATCVSFFWIGLIMWQMWPPIGFMLRSLDTKAPKKFQNLDGSTSAQIYICTSRRGGN